MHPIYAPHDAAASTKAEANARLNNHVRLVAARDIEADEELRPGDNDDPEDFRYYDSLREQYGFTWDWLCNGQPSYGRLTSAGSRIS